MNSRRTRAQKSKTVSGSYSDYREYYSYTSEAHSLYPKTYTSREHSRKKTKRGTHARPKTKQKIKYMLSLDGKSLFSLRMKFSILSIFILSLSLIYISAKVTNTSTQKAQLMNEIKAVEDDLAYINEELEYNIDDEKIILLATKNLKMHNPFDYQIVHIDVPILNKTYQYASAPEKKNFSIDKVSLLSAIIGE